MVYHSMLPLAQQHAGLLWQHALGRGGSPSGDARAGEHPAQLHAADLCHPWVAMHPGLTHTLSH